MKRVLSIDYDYFLRATHPDAWHYYPDCGREFSNTVTNIVWVERYATAKAFDQDMEKLFIVDQDSLRKVITYLTDETTIRTCLVADSHASIYPFIKELANGGEPVEVVNIDHHHDSWDNEKGLNCGNWLKLLLDEGVVTSATWCCDDGKAFTEKESRADKRVHRVNVLERALSKGPFDALFICRSGTWTPPHLDTPFLMGLLLAVSTRSDDENDPLTAKYVGGDDLLKTRYDKKFQDSVAPMAEAIRQVTEGLQRRNSGQGECDTP